jgi:hypothetical protein
MSPALLFLGGLRLVLVLHVCIWSGLLFHIRACIEIAPSVHDAASLCVAERLSAVTVTSVATSRSRLRIIA